MNRTGKRWAACAVCLVALGCLVLLGCSASESLETTEPLVDQRIEIETVPVQRSKIATTLETVGTLLPIRATTIVSEVDGVIRRLPDSQFAFELEEHGQRLSVPLGLDIGSMVQQGDVLVELDSRDAELALEQAEARLRLAQTRLEELQSWKRKEEVDQARAQVDEAQAHWELATVELERVRRLMATNSTSQGNLDAAQAVEAQSRAALARARAALDLATQGPTVEQLAIARAEVASAEIDVRQHQRDLEKTVIRSPYTAVITDRYVDVGDRLTAMPRVEIMQIVDPRVLFAEIDVPERFLGQVREHAPAEIYGPADAEPTAGRVELINGRVDPETRTFRARIGIDNRTGRLKAGGLARVVLEIASEAEAVIVPRRAVSFNNGQPSVFLYQPDGHVDRRPVMLGITNSEACQILGGVEPGEPVAVTNLALLADRSLVRLAAHPAVGSPRVAAREERP
ncbi:MAG: efflux RND transporter periplasmic adaptor subunit [Pirellulaceae bacterium]|nr:efflux RND transporter periplasmic adaptor subunit [Pirellulaceae bacterium]